MKEFLILAIFASVLTGCDYLPTSENKAKKIVAGGLIDPESARFESISAGLKEGGLCGFVNGKNRMGGYAGASPFIVNVQTGELEIGQAPVKREDFKQWRSLYNLDMWDELFALEKVLLNRCKFPDRWKDACKESYGNPFERPAELCSALELAATSGIRNPWRTLMREAFP
jgi:hypothetical protein